MDCEAPIPAPSPNILADLSARRSWDEGVSDHCRQLHEWNADTVRSLIVEIARLKNRNEHLEAEVATYAALLYGPNQKGGAA